MKPQRRYKGKRQRDEPLERDILQPLKMSLDNISLNVDREIVDEHTFKRLDEVLSKIKDLSRSKDVLLVRDRAYCLYDKAKELTLRKKRQTPVTVSNHGTTHIEREDLLVEVPNDSTNKVILVPEDSGETSDKDNHSADVAVLFEKEKEGNQHILLAPIPDIIPPGQSAYYVYDGFNMTLQQFIGRTEAVLSAYPQASDRLKYIYLLKVTKGMPHAQALIFEDSDTPFQNVWKTWKRRITQKHSPMQNLVEKVKSGFAESVKLGLNLGLAALERSIIVDRPENRVTQSEIATLCSTIFNALPSYLLYKFLKQNGVKSSKSFTNSNLQDGMLKFITTTVEDKETMSLYKIREERLRHSDRPSSKTPDRSLHCLACNNLSQSLEEISWASPSS